MQALPETMKRDLDVFKETGRHNPVGAAGLAYMYADAMMKVRDE